MFKIIFLHIKNHKTILFLPFIIIYLLVPLIFVLNIYSKASEQQIYINTMNAIEFYVPIICAWCIVVTLNNYIDNKNEVTESKYKNLFFYESIIIIGLFVGNLILLFSIFLVYFDEFKILVFYSLIKSITQSIFFGAVAFLTSILIKSTLFTFFIILIYEIFAIFYFVPNEESLSIIKYINIFTAYRPITIEYLYNRYLWFFLFSILMIGLGKIIRKK